MKKLDQLYETYRAQKDDGTDAEGLERLLCFRRDVHHVIGLHLWTTKWISAKSVLVTATWKWHLIQSCSWPTRAVLEPNASFGPMMTSIRDAWFPYQWHAISTWSNRIWCHFLVLLHQHLGRVLPLLDVCLICSKQVAISDFGIDSKLLNSTQYWRPPSDLWTYFDPTPWKNTANLLILLYDGALQEYDKEWDNACVQQLFDPETFALFRIY